MINTKKQSHKELPSDSQLLKLSTVATLVWLVLCVCIVLPAEYGIDPTGLGKILDLTEMGQIKTKLMNEANDEKLDLEQNIPSNIQDKKLTQTNDIKEDVIQLILRPNDATEIKLEMRKGLLAKYSWVTKGGGLNYNLHGDGYRGSKNSVTYKKGRMVESDSGEIIADFDGYHGWFLRNRNSEDVTVILKTEGDYIQIKKMK